MPGSGAIDALRGLIEEGRRIRRRGALAERQLAWHAWQAKIRDVISADPDMQGLSLSSEYREIDRDIEKILSLVRRLEHRAGTTSKKDAAPQPNDMAGPKSDEIPQDKHPGNKPVRVFLSYLTEDEFLARLVEKELKALSPNRVEVFNAHDQIQSGVPWKEEIYARLRESDWFVMIYTDPDRDWQWPIHEATAFETIRMAERADDNRLSCLHATDEFPRTLNDYQHHRVVLYQPDPALDEARNQRRLQGFYENESRLFRFLNDFINYPGFAQVAGQPAAIREQLVEAAHRIAAGFQQAITECVEETTVYPPRLVVELYPDDDRGTTDFRADSRVELNDRSTHVFGIAINNLTWGDFLRRYRKAKSEIDPLIWTQQLEDAINTATDGGVPQGNFAVLYSELTNNFLRPVLVRQEKYISGKRRFYVALIEQPAMEFPSNRSLGVVLASLILASRFRFEFLGTQSRRLQMLENPADFSQYGKESMQLIIAIESEASQHGLTSPDAVQGAFSREDQQNVARWTQRWYELREDLFGCLCADVGGAESLMLAKRQIQDLLSELRKINSAYLCLSIKRYAHLVGVELDLALDAGTVSSLAPPSDPASSESAPPRRATRKATAKKKTTKKALPRKKAGST